jgi:sucrose-phosphate synthase
LLTTDVDDTLLGDDKAFSEFVVATSQLPDLLVVLNSARPIPSLRESLRDIETDWKPFGLIGALGTEIELNETRLPNWSRQFADFDRGPIDALMTQLGCEPHEDRFQTPFKASFAVPPRLQAEAEDLVQRTGVPAQIIVSGETNFDVIPVRAGKGAALRYVQKMLGIPSRRTVASGDSCNDRDMLVARRGIAVGNATAKLRRALRGSGVYFAKRTHAAGILEGLRRLGVPLRRRVGP